MNDFIKLKLINAQSEPLIWEGKIDMEIEGFFVLGAWNKGGGGRVTENYKPSEHEFALLSLHLL